MEKTEGKIRYGLIGIGAQGGSYARFLTNAPLRSRHGLRTVPGQLRTGRSV